MEEWDREKRNEARRLSLLRDERGAEEIKGAEEVGNDVERRAKANDDVATEQFQPHSISLSSPQTQRPRAPRSAISLPLPSPARDLSRNLSTREAGAQS